MGNIIGYNEKNNENEKFKIPMYLKFKADMILAPSSCNIATNILNKNLVNVKVQCDYENKITRIIIYSKNGITLYVDDINEIVKRDYLEFELKSETYQNTLFEIKYLFEDDPKIYKYLNQYGYIRLPIDKSMKYYYEDNKYRLTLDDFYIDVIFINKVLRYNDSMYSIIIDV